MMEYLSQIQWILFISFAGSILVFLAGRVHPYLRNLIILLIPGIVGYGIFIVKNMPLFHLSIGGFSLAWGINEYDFIFAILAVAIMTAALLFSISYIRERQNYFYFNMILTFASVIGILAAKDFLSLFIFWEIMTWSSFLLVLYDGDKGKNPSIIYFIFSASGAYLMLTALLTLQSSIGSLDYSLVFAKFSSISIKHQWMIVLFFIAAFGVKSALMPLHIWAKDAYSLSPMSFTAFFSGVLSKMGIFGFGLVFFKLLHVMDGKEYLLDTIAWLGAITSVMATIYAAIQKDAKKLLAFSSVAQLGYIITALAIGTPLAVMSGLFMAIMHGVFKSLLFLAIGGVEYRTGMSDMDELTGLIRKMPVSFLAVLMGIITVAGLPPLGGFVGKWMLYESLIQSGHYYLVIMTFFSSTAAYLYLYRLIFSLFLGQEEPEFNHIKEVPFVTMQLPMLILAGITFVLGVFPGFLMEPIAESMKVLGFSGVTWKMSILTNEWGNHIDLITITSSIFTVFLFAAIVLTFKNRKRTHYATTKDIHTSGEVPMENENLTFAINFYQPYQRALGPVLKYKMTNLWNIVGRSLEEFFDFIRNIYSGNAQSYAAYTLVFLAILLILSDWIF